MSEGFLSRWSRVKTESLAGAVPPGTMTGVKTTEVPSLVQLAEEIAHKGLDADFVPFMQAGVEEAMRRTAIQQLFKQPVFNVMDGLDVYIENFNVFEPIAAETLPTLAHARAILSFEQVQTAAEESPPTAGPADLPSAEDAA